jgi:hypothetical protein
MITAIVRFNIPKEVTLEEARNIYQGTAPKYQGLPGLVRKYYLYGEEGEVGGVYLWESREQAEAFYDADWKKYIADRYGAEPKIQYFESPVIVDNAHSEVIVDAAE